MMYPRNNVDTSNMNKKNYELRLPGYPKKIEVMKIGNKEKVLIRGVPYMSWDSYDLTGRRVAISELYETGIAGQEELAEAFNVNIKTVYNYIASFRRNGIKSLVDQPKGPKESWKIIPRKRSKILIIFLKEGIKNLTEIQKRLKEEWNEEISIESIRQVLIENGFIKEGIKSIKIEQRNLFENVSSNERQLELEIFEKNTEKENIAECVDSDELNEVAEINSSYCYKDLSNYSPKQRIYLDQLERSSNELRIEKGEYNAYGGGLLFAPLLNRYNFINTIKRVIEIKTYGGYSLEELCLTLFYFDIFGFRSIENFKTVYSEEFGVLIGKIDSPSILTLRRFLGRIKELKKGEELMEGFAKEYLKSGLVKWGVLYIDSHFLPYYGMQAITMGWYAIRDKPLKGSYNFVSTDGGFNPFIFLIRPSSEDLVEKIPEIIIKAKKVANIGLEEKKLTVIFDREGYSAELFGKLNDQKEACHVSFISWAKYTDGWVNDFTEEKFKNKVMIKYKIQDSEEVKYFETERTMSKYGKIRAIVIESGRKKKRTAMYTNDKERPAEEIIQLICTRWGQENLHKGLKYNHYIDYYPGKGWNESEEIEDQPMVENPDITELKKQKAILINKLNKLKIKIADKVLVMSDEVMNWEELKKERLEIISDIVGIESEITLLDRKMDKLPKEIKFEEAHDGIKLFELDYEKKRFLDCIKIFTYHMKKQMSEVLHNYYNKKKEIYPALEMIIKRGANIKMERGRLIVRLKRFMDPEIDYAARHLCEELNQMKPITLDKFRLPILYEVA